MIEPSWRSTTIRRAVSRPPPYTNPHPSTQHIHINHQSSHHPPSLPPHHFNTSHRYHNPDVTRKPIRSPIAPAHHLASSASTSSLCAVAPALSQDHDPVDGVSVEIDRLECHERWLVGRETGKLAVLRLRGPEAQLDLDLADDHQVGGKVLPQTRESIDLSETRTGPRHSAGAAPRGSTPSVRQIVLEPAISRCNDIVATLKQLLKLFIVDEPQASHATCRRSHPCGKTGKSTLLMQTRELVGELRDAECRQHSAMLAGIDLRMQAPGLRLAQTARVAGECTCS